MTLEAISPMIPYRSEMPGHIRMPSRRSLAGNGINELSKQLNDETTEVKLHTLPGVVSLITYVTQVSPTGEQQTKEVGIGSGFVIAPGIIATNRHVVEESQKDQFEGLAVANSQLAPDGTPRERKYFKSTQVLYTSPDFDVAFVGYDPQEHPDIEMPALEVGSVNDVQAGDLVMTLGSPWDLPDTVAIGHISHDGIRYLGDDDKNPYVQIDASVRHGNSGGPTVNLENGQVVGVVTADIMEDATTGFMIPVDVFRQEFSRWQQQEKFAQADALVDESPSAVSA